MENITNLQFSKALPLIMYVIRKCKSADTYVYQMKELSQLFVQAFSAHENMLIKSIEPILYSYWCIVSPTVPQFCDYLSKLLRMVKNTSIMNQWQVAQDLASSALFAAPRMTPVYILY